MSTDGCFVAWNIGAIALIDGDSRILCFDECLCHNHRLFVTYARDIWRHVLRHTHIACFFFLQLGIEYDKCRPAGWPSRENPNREWVVDPGEFASKGKNTPLAGTTLKGRVIATLVEGQVVFQDAPLPRKLAGREG